MTAQLYSHRPFHGPPDLQAMLALVALRPPERINAYPFMLDLREVTGTPEGQASIRLWEDAGGAVVAFALLDGPFIAFEISPAAPFDDLACQMIAWGAEKLAPGGGSPEPPAELITNCREEDAQRQAFLEKLGFSAQPERTLHFTRSLSIPIAAPRLPEGFQLRPTCGEAEAAAWVQLHRAAHQTEIMTVNFRLSMLRTAEYRRDLDLVAVAPDGQLAAYAMCHFSPEENQLRSQKVGYTDPVATHPDFQGKGLARALLLEGFERLKASGMEFVEVSTADENLAMIRTAESAGFQRYATTIFFSRPLT